MRSRRRSRSSHHDDLVEAVQDGELWKLWYTVIPEPAQMKAEIERRLDRQAKGGMLPFAVRDTGTAKVVGMTSYWNVDQPNRRLEIGGTWYRKSMQRTALTTECKLLLLTHAFETLDCICVELRQIHLQSCQPARYRAAGSEAGWNIAKQPGAAERDHPRYMCLQHHRERMAGGENKP